MSFNVLFLILALVAFIQWSIVTKSCAFFKGGIMGIFLNLLVVKRVMLFQAPFASTELCVLVMVHIEGNPRYVSVKLFLNWTSGSGGDIFIYISIFSSACPFC